MTYRWINDDGTVQAKAHGRRDIEVEIAGMPGGGLVLAKRPALKAWHGLRTDGDDVHMVRAAEEFGELVIDYRAFDPFASATESPKTEAREWRLGRVLEVVA